MAHNRGIGLKRRRVYDEVVKSLTVSSLNQRLVRQLPVLAAIAAGLIGLVNIGSALTPDVRWRGHLLLQFEPVEWMRLFHALALPAGAALLLVAPYLAKRRRRAWQVGIVLALV